MIVAYVLINVRPIERGKLVEKYRGEPCVKEVHEVYGICDVVMKIEVKDLDELRKFIDELRKEEGVESTTTMIAS